MTNAHYFFALALPAEIKQALSQVMTEFKRDMPFKKWVHPEDLHITLAFLGAAEASKLEASISCIEQALYSHSAFSLTINHLGVFGRKDTPRILWAGAEKSSSLTEMREKVYSCCIDAGMELDRKPFAPHITLARRWTGNKSFSTDLLHTIIKEHTFLANKVVLYQTHIDKTPKYEEKESFILKP